MFPYSKTYTNTELTVTAGSDYAANEVDVGALLKVKFGSARNIPGFSGFIVTSASIKVKFNSIDNDAITFDTDLMGNLWVIARDDLIVDKIYFAKSASPTGSASVQVFMVGSEKIRL